MNADIKVIYKHKDYFEPMADVIVKSSRLKGITIKEEMVPSLIDELPILMVAASLARGKSIFKGAGELRVKETDRIKSMSVNLSRMGVKINTKVRGSKEDVVIEGRETLRGADLKSFGDHRTAMSMIVAALCASSSSEIDDTKCISKSFPDFSKVLNSILKY
jgi:3-phosphoshikimate 1-carboxyvinyltransferase